MPLKNKKYNKAIKTSYNVFDAGSMFLYMLIFPVLMSLIFAVFLQIIANFSGITWENFSNLKSVVIINQFSVQIFFAIVFFVYNKKTNTAIVKATHLKREFNVYKILIVLAISVTTLVFLSPIVSLFEYLFTLVGYNPSNEIPIALNNVSDLLLALLSAALLPAILEELVFRGVVLNGLRQKFSANQAVIFSAIMFTLMHGALQQTVFQFLLGVVLGLIFVITGNLIYPIIFHFANNAIVLLATYFANTTNATQTPVVFDGFMSFFTPILMLLVGVLIVAVLLLLLTGKGKEHLKNIFSGKKFNINSIYAKQDNIILINTQQTSISGEQQKTVATQIVVEEPTEKKGFASLTTNEMFVLILGVVISGLIWLSTTFSVIFGG